MNIDATLFFDLLLLVMHINTDKTRDLSSQLVELFEEQSQNIAPRNINHIKLYIDIAQEIINYRLVIDDNRGEIINLISKHTNNPIFRKDRTIKDGLLALLDSKVNPERLSALLERLNNVVVWYKSNIFVRKIFGNLKDCQTTYNPEDQADIIDDMKGLVGDFKDTLLDMDSSVGKNGPVEVIDFTSKESIHVAAESFREKAVSRTIKTGLQGLNKMLGEYKGFILGTMSVFAALQHNFKSGMLVSILRWIPEFNDPIPGGPKKNVVVFISLENMGYMNMMNIYKYIYTETHGTAPPTDISIEDIASFVYEHFNKLGYTLLVYRFIPSAFGYDELVRLYEKLVAAGYEITAIIIDYLEKMKKSGNASKIGNYQLVADLFSDVKNYFNAVGTNIFTAAQLNRDAAVIVGGGLKQPVKYFSERHLAGSIGIGREADFIAYTHIEKDDFGKSWLTVKWGKHRDSDQTPESDKFFGYRFEQHGIPNDVGKKASFVRDVYSANNNKSENGTDEVADLLGL